MLQITIPEFELWDEPKQEFIPVKEQTLQLEHSLVSLSKWESKWCKSFMSSRDKTDEETLDYIRCMTITKNVNPLIYHGLRAEHIKQINAYIEAPMTATWFSKKEKKGKLNNETITAELIYYWMIALQIPVEFEKWHLNRLITLIRVCNIKNQPPKKMNRRELLARNKALNDARRKQLNTTG